MFILNVEILQTFIVEELMTETDSGDDTPVIVFVMVVMPRTVERLIPVPATKFSDRLALTVVATTRSVVMTLVFVIKLELI
jgi:hypothetical protein